MSVEIIIGDALTELRKLPSQSVDCVVTSPPYWGLRDYGVEGQLGLEPTLGEHIAAMVEVFREVHRVLKAHGTLWLNYGDCYAAPPNGKSAEAYKADGSDDRTFRDKPFSTVGPINGRTYIGDRAGDGSRGIDRDFHDAVRAKSGPIYQPASSIGGVRGSNKGNTRGTGPGRVTAGGYLKPKDLCMIPNRLAIALQDDGWFVRSEIIWHKPNPMPESVYDRPTSAHEKIWLLTKGEDYFYNHEAIREPVTGGSKPRVAGPNSRTVVDRVPKSKKKVPAGWDTEPGRHGTINRQGRTEPTYVDGPGTGKKGAPEGDPFRKAKGSFNAALVHMVETRNARNVWTIAPKAFRDAHFATFPPALAERCIKAGVPESVCGACGAVEHCGGLCSAFQRVPGKVLDPFGGAGTVGLVAQQLGRDSILIELNPEYAEITRRRLGMADAIGAAA